MSAAIRRTDLLLMTSPNKTIAQKPKKLRVHACMPVALLVHDVVSCLRKVSLRPYELSPCSGSWTECRSRKSRGIDALPLSTADSPSDAVKRITRVDGQYMKADSGGGFLYIPVYTPTHTVHTSIAHRSLTGPRCHRQMTWQPPPEQRGISSTQASSPLSCHTFSNSHRPGQRAAASDDRLVTRHVKLDARLSDS